MTDISQEAHEAMVAKAVADATRVTEAALATKTTEAADATTKAAEAEKAAADLKADNERLNKELDDAQVKAKAAEDRAKEAEDKLKKSEDDAALAEVAERRAAQVKALGIFDDEYVADKAGTWASYADEAWADKVVEWQKLKGTPTTEKPNGDTASALKGASDAGLATEQEQDDAAAGGAKTPSARRAALGLRAKE